MKIKILSSGSHGNAYIVSDGATRLMLDCGLTWGKLQKRSGYSMSRVDGVFVTHEHGDHAKGVNAAILNGKNIYCSTGTAEALGIADNAHTEILKDRQEVNIGTFRVLPLSVEHDAAEPMAFLLQSNKTNERLIYATDTPYIPYKIPGITHMMVEANYDAKLMELSDVSLNHRVMKAHMSIDALIEWIITGASRDTVQEIWLLHLSDKRSDGEDFRRRIQAKTGAEVYVA